MRSLPRAEVRRTIIPLAAATTILLLMYSLALTSAARKSPTFDEQGFITRGLGYLRGQNHHMRVGHPLGLNALNAALLASDDTVHLPTEDASWQLTSYHRPSELFMWEIGNDVEHVIFLARLPTMWLGLLLAALCGRWAWELTRNRWAGLLALTLIAVDPNILAHTRLATTDLGTAAAALLAGYTLWRFLRRPGWRAAVAAGATFGLLQNTKFTALLYLPLFAVVVGIALLARRISRDHHEGEPAQPSPTGGTRAFLLMSFVVYPACAFLALWASYGFQVGTLPEDLPRLPQLGGLTLPLAHHLEQLLDIGGRLQKTTPSFLLGQYSDKGWWYYFPAAFLFKTPEATLILLGWAILGGIRKVIARARRVISGNRIIDVASLLMPAVGYFAIALTSEINLGYRHLLPALPFLCVFVAYSLMRLRTGPSGTLRRGAIALLVAWLGISTLRIYPHFLAYFNQLAGGPDNGWRALVDSNIDWGQDLAALRPWMDEHGVGQVWLSYFGEARPEYYGIDYSGLDSYPPRLMNPLARPFFPADPAPGTYAISVTNLQGVHFANHDQFSWFRERTPTAKIGYSIFIYEVAASGEPADVVMSGIQLDEIDEADYRLFGGNNVTAHWFDASQSLLIPRGENTWWVLGTQFQADLPWRSELYSDPIPVAGRDYLMYRQVNLPTQESSTASPAHFRHDGGQILLRSVTVNESAAEQGADIHLVTIWEQQAQPRPVKIFVHAIAPDGSMPFQWDGLGATWEGWRPGDTLIQQHLLSVPGQAPVGVYELWLGLYHPESGRRWGTSESDRLLVGTVEVRPGE